MQAVALESLLLTLLKFAGVIALLLIADRWLHRQLQGVFYLLTGDNDLALSFYAILLFPGVLLHELSHAFVATILGVRTGKMSLLPRKMGRSIQLGSVLVQQTGIIRASLIGAAPLIFGGLAVMLIGQFIFGTPEMVEVLAAGNLVVALDMLLASLKAINAWIWGYLVFAIGNTMIPSKSDIHAWPQVALLIVGFIVFIVVIGGSGELLVGAGSLFSVALNWVVLLGGSILLINVPVALFLLGIQKLLEHLKGVRLEYRR